MSKLQNNIFACLSTTCYTWRSFGNPKCSLSKIELIHLSFSFSPDVGQWQYLICQDPQSRIWVPLPTSKSHSVLSILMGKWFSNLPLIFSHFQCCFPRFPTTPIYRHCYLLKNYTDCHSSAEYSLKAPCHLWNEVQTPCISQSHNEALSTFPTSCPINFPQAPSTPVQLHFIE